MRDIRKIVIHCTDSSDSMDVGFKEINDWHRERGWKSPSGISCGYHYIIRRDGTIEEGRPEEEIGAHVKGHNSDSLGIVWVGKKDITPNQERQLLWLIKDRSEVHQIDIDDVLGHYELDSHKTCPNLNMNLIRAELLFTQTRRIP